MDSEQRFWIGICFLIFAALTVLLVMINVNGLSKRQAIIELVEAGAHPVVASCAVHPDHVTLCAQASRHQ